MTSSKVIHSEHELVVPSISRMRAYPDTVELHVLFVPRGSLVRIRRAGCGKCFRQPCLDATGNPQGFRIIVQQPTPNCLRVLDEVLTATKGSVFRLDAAFDFFVDNNEDFANWLKQSATMPWRRCGMMFSFSDTDYWVWQKRRRARSNRDFGLYYDQPSKLQSDWGPAVHFELKFYRSIAVRAAGILKPSDIIGLDPARLFKRNVKLLVHDQFEKLVIKATRRAVKEDRARYKGRTSTKFVDWYRSQIPRHIRSVMKRMHLDRAQRLKDLKPSLFKRLKVIDTSLIPLPRTMEFVSPPLKSKNNS